MIDMHLGSPRELLSPLISADLSFRRGSLLSVGGARLTA
jgi:hypothetical protein